MVSTQVLRRHFRRLSGLPSWGVTEEYGVLGLSFGVPRLQVREAIPDSKVRALQRRRTWISGQHLLLVEPCNWEVLHAPRRRIASDQQPHLRKRAARALNGQVLVNLVLTVRPLSATFHFDQGTRLVLKRQRRAPRDSLLWRLYSPRSYVGLRSDAQLEFGTLRPERLHLCQVMSLELAV